MTAFHRSNAVFRSLLCPAEEEVGVVAELRKEHLDKAGQEHERNPPWETAPIEKQGVVHVIPLWGKEQLHPLPQRKSRMVTGLAYVVVVARRRKMREDKHGKTGPVGAVSVIVVGPGMIICLAEDAHLLHDGGIDICDVAVGGFALPEMFSVRLDKGVHEGESVDVVEASIRESTRGGIHRGTDVNTSLAICSEAISFCGEKVAPKLGKHRDVVIDPQVAIVTAFLQSRLPGVDHAAVPEELPGPFKDFDWDFICPLPDRIRGPVGASVVRQEDLGFDPSGPRPEGPLDGIQTA